MFDTRFLIRFFDKIFILKLFFIGLLISLVPIGEILLIIYVAEKLGAFLILALAALIGLIGTVSVYGQIKTLLASIKSKVSDGVYPTVEFAGLAGGLFTAVLFLMPGFVTDLAAVILLLPSVKKGLGRTLIRNMDGRLKELYQYLKMY